jgi:hypothetical protein
MGADSHYDVSANLPPNLAVLLHPGSIALGGTDSYNCVQSRLDLFKLQQIIKVNKRLPKIAIAWFTTSQRATATWP